jgi:hypothetical protein
MRLFSAGSARFAEGGPEVAFQATDSNFIFPALYFSSRRRILTQ